MQNDPPYEVCLFVLEDVPYWVYVSEEDWEDASRFKWHPSGGKKRDARGKLVGRYAARREIVDGRPWTIYLHRWVAHRAGLIPSLTVTVGMAGRWGSSIDHINGDKLDNRRSNLRVADRKLQANNPADGLIATNKTGHEGVSFTKDRPHYPWYAYGDVQGKTVSLGTFATLEEAVTARKTWEQTRVVPPASGRIRPDNTTGVRGVYLTKRNPPLPKPWYARVMVKGEYIQLGYFATKDEAAAARKAWDDSH